MTQGLNAYLESTLLELSNDVKFVEIPYFRDQTPRLLLISSHDLLRLLFEGGQ